MEELRACGRHALGDARRTGGSSSNNAANNNAASSKHPALQARGGHTADPPLANLLLRLRLRVGYLPPFQTCRSAWVVG